MSGTGKQEMLCQLKMSPKFVSSTNLEDETVDDNIGTGAPTGVKKIM